jgi:hypothetical protein
VNLQCACRAGLQQWLVSLRRECYYSYEKKSSTRNIEADVLETFDVHHLDIFNQDFGVHDFAPYPPIDGANASTFNFQISKYAPRLIDLKNSFIRTKITLNSTTGITPNSMIAVGNNALIHMYLYITVSAMVPLWKQ